MPAMPPPRRPHHAAISHVTPSFALNGAVVLLLTPLLVFTVTPPRFNTPAASRCYVTTGETRPHMSYRATVFTIPDLSLICHAAQRLFLFRCLFTTVVRCHAEPPAA